ncbi:MAG: nitroreductase [Candidatus Eisenbacteria bacterium]|nr:nitroreductase [Candidatus Eisenbacteria bacterium]
MDVSQAIRERRAYRSLAPLEIDQALVEDLATHAGLSASCFNHQPWRFVFTYEPRQLRRLHEALSSGNAWARKASLIVAVASRRDLDCVVKKRVYYLFDTGMATALLILRATERGLVAHPIAGFRESRVKAVLEIPEDMRVITLVVIGARAAEIDSELNEKQRTSERQRPARRALAEFAYENRYPAPTTERNNGASR